MGVYKIADADLTAEDNTAVYINYSGGYMTHSQHTGAWYNAWTA